MLPLLVPSYDVPVDALGRVAAGPGTIRVTIGTTQGAPASPVDTAGRAVVHGRRRGPGPPRRCGRSAAAGSPRTSANPAGSTVSLRLTGRDRAGNTLTQTLVRAYAVR